MNKEKVQLITSFFSKKDSQGQQSTQSDLNASLLSQINDLNLNDRNDPGLQVFDYDEFRDIKSKQKEDTFKNRGVIFPILLKFPLVAKFLCNFGQTQRIANFAAPYRLFLEREPENRYDPHAVKCGLVQEEQFWLEQIVCKPEVREGQMQEEEEEEQKFYLGYVPKDIAYYLSTILDYDSVFLSQNMNYETVGKTGVLEVELQMQPYILRDQRAKLTGSSFYLKTLPGMPRVLKRAVYGIKKYNQLKTFEDVLDYDEENESLLGDACLNPLQENAGLVLQEEDDPMEGEEGQAVGQEPESNKHIRNFKLVLETAKAFEHLFSEEERKFIDEYVGEISTSAQTLLARLVQRKRKWFLIDQSLINYVGSQEELCSALDELLRLGHLVPDLCVFEAALDHYNSDDCDEIWFKLEPLAEFFECFPLGTLQEISKVVNQIVKRVELDNFVEVTEVGQNPFYRYCEYVDAYGVVDDQLAYICESAKHVCQKFGDLISQYFAEKKKGRKNGNKRELVRKVLKKVVGLLKTSKYRPQGQADQSHSLLQFFQFQRNELTQRRSYLLSNENYKKAKQKVKQIVEEVRQLSNGGKQVVKVSERVANLWNRALRLFYFYQVKDPFEALQFHDYGFNQFQEFDNFLQAKTTMGGQEMPEYLRPLFDSREEFLKFDSLCHLAEVIAQVKDMKIKDPKLLGQVFKKLSKKLLSLFCCEHVRFSQICIKSLLTSKVECLLQKTKNSHKLRDAPFPCLKSKYSLQHKLGALLHHCVEFLEKGKRYDVACVVLVQLLMAEAKPEKRGKWWVRLCVDLKHLRMRNLAARVAQYALLDWEYVQTGNKNALIKIRDQLKTLNAKKEKAPKGKKKRGGVEVEEEEKVVVVEVEEPPVMTQINTQYYVDNQIIKESINRDYYKDVHIRCKKALTYLYQQTQSFVPGMEQIRPYYHNPFSNEFFDVENLALRYYALHERLNGMHCENSFGKTLFGILMWEQIFYDKIPYVFQTPFQGAPLDFGTKNFYIARKEILEERLEQIEEMDDEELAREIGAQFDRNKNKFNNFVSWDSLKLNRKRLVEIGTILGGSRLSRIIGNYCRDYKFWNHGMPDLILWDRQTGRVKFSEVKSENDSLSEVQRSWIAFFSQNCIDIEVCYVNRHPEDQETPEIDVFTEEIH